MPRLLNLRQIEAFRAVMLMGTTVRASDSLGVTQPAVSRMITSLELEVGVKLFTRSRGRLRPTLEAESLFGEVERTYLGLEHLTNYARGVRQQIGHMRLLATMPMAHGLLPEALQLFRAEHPSVTVAVKTVIRRDIQSWLESQQFDLAITNFPVDYPVASTRPLIEVGCVCVFPEGHPLQEKRVVEAADIRGLPFVAMAPETYHRLKLEQALRSAELVPSIVMEAQTGMLVCAFVLSGLGISVVDEITAGIFKGRGLVSRPFHPAFTYEFRLLYPTQRLTSRATEEFADIVTQVVGRRTASGHRQTKAAAPKGAAAGRSKQARRDQGSL